jgi:hypothetical protein
VSGRKLPSSSVPAAIFIIRHGEKPHEVDRPPHGVDVHGQPHGDSLVPQGWQRAGGLAGLFDPAGGVFQNSLLATPTIIAVPDYRQPSKHRTYQTVLPLCLKLSRQPTITVDVGKELHLATWLLRQVDQTILVCWEHDHIADIITALAPCISGGVAPGPWPHDRFDVVVALTSDPGHPGSFLCAQVPQLLLAGDSTDPIPPGAAQQPRR